MIKDPLKSQNSLNNVSVIFTFIIYVLQTIDFPFGSVLKVCLQQSIASRVIRVSLIKQVVIPSLQQESTANEKAA